MWFASANRKVLLDLVTGKDPFSILEIKSANSLEVSFIGRKELLLIWQEKPTVGVSVPDMIWVKPRQIDDFLAWTSTYLLGLQPFTAYCRVVDCDVVDKIVSSRKKASLGNIQGPCIGTIIGESITHLNNDDIKAITPISILSTYSFAMAKASALGIMRDEGEDFITKRWINARELTRQPKRVLDAEQMKDVWTVLGLLNAGSVSKKLIGSYHDDVINVFNVCQKLGCANSMSAKTWEILTGKLPLLRKSFRQMKGTREQRVFWFERCSVEIRDKHSNKQTVGAFLCALLASQIAPGSMKYVELLRPFVKCFPSVITWYGLCEGAYSRTMTYDYGYGLGWRILRDLLRWEPICGKPTGDIGIEELQVLCRSQESGIRVRPMSHAFLVVEIAPSVQTAFAWPPHSKNDVVSKDDRRDELVDDAIEQLRQLLEKASVICNDVVRGKKGTKAEAKQDVPKRKSSVRSGRKPVQGSLLDLSDRDAV